MFYGKEASAYTKKRLEKEIIELEFDVDKKGSNLIVCSFTYGSSEELFLTVPWFQEGYARISYISSERQVRGCL